MSHASSLHYSPGLLSGPYPEKIGARTSAFGEFKDSVEKTGRDWLSRTRAYEKQAIQVEKLVAIYASMGDRQFQQTRVSVRQKLALKGLNTALSSQAIALVSEAIYREIGLRAYRNQIMAAAVMLDDRLAEMHTGEGKTLSTIMAAGAAALAGTPTHVMTANDYLVGRDAEQAREIFKRLKLSVGCVLTGQSPDVRRQQYLCDVTYSTAKEVVFDYLKDLRVRRKSRKGLATRAQLLQPSAVAQNEKPLLRGLCFALVDEADSIFLDEATTPLILSKQGKSPVSERDYRVAMRIGKLLDEDLHYNSTSQYREVELLPAGIARIKQDCEPLTGLWNVSRFREALVKQAITAWRGYEPNKDYMVRDEEVHIIDQTTGRIAEGRQWSNGLHQMIEIKEDCEVSPQNETIAQITYQTFFPRYLKIGGTSATLAEAKKELSTVYSLPVVKIPRNKESSFRHLGQRTFIHQQLKWDRLVASTQNAISSGRPVLVGTDSIRTTSEVSAVLHNAQIEHVVLSAAQDENEAAIVAAAGQKGKVTVTTNMAGRGTDIKLSPDTLRAGGLHVINCQHNPSRRVDRQLSGRCARQGDPGSAEVIVSLDDLMFRKHLPISIQRLLSRVAVNNKHLPGWLAYSLSRWVQFSSEFIQREQRSQLRQNDKQMRDWLALGGAGE